MHEIMQKTWKKNTFSVKSGVFVVWALQSVRKSVAKKTQKGLSRKSRDQPFLLYYPMKLVPESFFGGWFLCKNHPPNPPKTRWTGLPCPVQLRFGASLRHFFLSPMASWMILRFSEFTRYPVYAIIEYQYLTVVVYEKTNRKNYLQAV